MNTIVNQYLFRHREVTSAAFNNLCTIIHRVPEEGVYAGEVVQRKRQLGTFRVTCDAKHESPQVNIDLSTFDTLFRANIRGLTVPDNSVVTKGGYFVFHASGPHDNLYVTLTNLSKEKGVPTFDSRRLQKGDFVAFRLWHPGSYTITNELGGQKAILTVLGGEHHKYSDLTKQTPTTMTLTDKGFEPGKIEKWPAQALVISLQTSASLILRSNKESPEARKVKRK